MSKALFQTNDIEIPGTSVSPGIAIGTAHHFTQIDLKSLEENRLPVDNTASEFGRLENALAISKEQLRGLQLSFLEGRDKDIIAIFGIQSQILSDASFLAHIKKSLSESKSNVEYVIANHIRELENKFKVMETEVLKSKILDVQDVYHRLLRNILDIEHVRIAPFRNMPSGAVLVAQQLLPSDMALLDLKKISGIIIENGSTVSHVSIIAKSLGVPTLINVSGILSLARSGFLLILDGYENKVVIKPTPSTVAAYEKKRAAPIGPHTVGRKAKQCSTKDGVTVRLEANAGSMSEVKEALSAGAQGIGLLRTELFYMSLPRLPTVEEETEYYRSILSQCKDKPLTIRLLDTGADKTLPYLSSTCEENPYLGVRGIRFLLHHPDILDNHLTSILRACDCGHIRILVPFVSLPREVDTVLHLLQKIGKKEGVNRSRYSFGIMVEVPAVVVALRSFIDKVDFLSIGTNDLVQYVFAASRENSDLEEYRAASFQVLLKLINYVVDANKPHQKELTVCGEVASDPALAPYLIGLGIRTLSMQITSLPGVCREIEKRSLGELTAMVKEYLEKL
jgi:phosphoenolpyruvate-protein phosphotransferase